jgi:hypothetical protein
MGGDSHNRVSSISCRWEAQAAAGAIGLWTAAPGGTLADRLAADTERIRYFNMAHANVHKREHFVTSICRCEAYIVADDGIESPFIMRTRGNDGCGSMSSD